MDRGYRIELCYLDDDKQEIVKVLGNEYPVGTDIRGCIFEAKKALSQIIPIANYVHVVWFDQLAEDDEVVWTSDIDLPEKADEGLLFQLRNIQARAYTLRRASEVFQARIHRPDQILASFEQVIKEVKLIEDGLQAIEENLLEKEGDNESA